MKTQIKTNELLCELNAMLNEFFVCENTILKDRIVLKFENDQKFELTVNEI